MIDSKLVKIYESCFDFFELKFGEINSKKYYYVNSLNNYKPDGVVYNCVLKLYNTYYAVQLYKGCYDVRCVGAIAKINSRGKVTGIWTYSIDKVLRRLFNKTYRTLLDGCVAILRRNDSLILLHGDNNDFVDLGFELSDMNITLANYPQIVDSVKILHTMEEKQIYCNEDFKYTIGVEERAIWYNNIYYKVRDYNYLVKALMPKLLDVAVTELSYIGFIDNFKRDGSRPYSLGSINRFNKSYRVSCGGSKSIKDILDSDVVINFPLFIKAYEVIYDRVNNSWDFSARLPVPLRYIFD